MRTVLYQHVETIISVTSIIISARHIHELAKDLNGRAHKSHMLKHSIEKHHDNVAQENFKIIAENFRNKGKRKLSESLWIKDLRPILNAQDKSVLLKLFN